MFPIPREARVRLTRSALRGAVVAAAALLLVGVQLSGPAHAASSGTLASAALRTSSIASSLAGSLGGRTAGSYLDGNGQLVVTVVDAAAAEQVRAAGAVAQLVSRSGAQLAAATAELDRSAAVPGTAWAVDPV